jgi:hypothetical protein
MLSPTDPAVLRMLADPTLSEQMKLAALHVEQEQIADRLQTLSELPPSAVHLIAAGMRRHFQRSVVRLPDGTIGYYERGGRTDDCWPAAVATCLQVPIDDVPDPRIDERLNAGVEPGEVNRSAWTEFFAWLADRRLRMTVHTSPPVRRRRWIGVVELPGLFMDHCLVMSRATILFDPVDRNAHERCVRTYSPAEVSCGFSFQRLEKTKPAPNRRSRR